MPQRLRRPLGEPLHRVSFRTNPDKPDREENRRLQSSENSNSEPCFPSTTCCVFGIDDITYGYVSIPMVSASSVTDSSFGVPAPTAPLDRVARGLRAVSGAVPGCQPRDRAHWTCRRRVLRDLSRRRLARLPPTALPTGARPSLRHSTPRGNAGLRPDSPTPLPTATCPRAPNSGSALSRLARSEECPGA